MGQIALDMLDTIYSATIVALVLASCVWEARKIRREFLIGLTTAFVAVVLTSLLAQTVRASGFAPEHLSIAVLSPFLAEGARTFSIFTFLPRTPPSVPARWISFALGYASFETLLKGATFLAISLLEPEASPSIAASVAIPLAPLALHLTLSALGIHMWSRGSAVRLVFVTTLLIHASYNAVVLFATGDDSVQDIVRWGLLLL